MGLAAEKDGTCPFSLPFLSFLILGHSTLGFVLGSPWLPACFSSCPCHLFTLLDPRGHSGLISWPLAGPSTCPIPFPQISR
jgi:hypothetical protein